MLLYAFLIGQYLAGNNKSIFIKNPILKTLIYFLGMFLSVTVMVYGLTMSLTGIKKIITLELGNRNMVWFFFGTLLFFESIYIFKHIIKEIQIVRFYKLTIKGAELTSLYLAFLVVLKTVWTTFLPDDSFAIDIKGIVQMFSRISNPIIGNRLGELATTFLLTLTSIYIIDKNVNSK